MVPSITESLSKAAQDHHTTTTVFNWWHDVLVTANSRCNRTQQVQLFFLQSTEYFAENFGIIEMFFCKMRLVFMFFLVSRWISPFIIESWTLNWQFLRQVSLTVVSHGHRLSLESKASEVSLLTLFIGCAHLSARVWLPTWRGETFRQKWP